MLEIPFGKNGRGFERHVVAKNCNLCPNVAATNLGERLHGSGINCDFFYGT